MKASTFKGFTGVFRCLRWAFMGMRRGGDDWGPYQRGRRHGVPESQQATLLFDLHSFAHCLVGRRAKSVAVADLLADPEERLGRAILRGGDEQRRGEIWAAGDTLQDRVYREKWAGLFRLCAGLFLTGAIIGSLLLWAAWAK
jgi:hypothetical protein